MSSSYPSSSALIIVDVQNDFCTGGNLAVPDGEQVVPIINQLSACFSTVVLTQDWHPAKHSSFASEHADASAFDTVDMAYGPQVLWPDHCIQGSQGSAFHPDLITNNAQLIIRKGMNPAVDSYSAFTEADKKTTTGLAGWLHAKGIKEVICVGLATDFCVGWTALDARKAGFEVAMQLEACRAIDLNNSLATMLEACQSVGVQIR